MSDIFERAARAKFRFPSTKGDLNTEQLYDLPLTSKTVGFSLDDVAKRINADLKAATEESFVAVATNPARGELTAKLDVVKAVIAYKIAENERRRTAANKAAEKQFLLDLLDKKRGDALGELSIEEIQARLNALES